MTSQSCSQQKRKSSPGAKSDKMNRKFYDLHVCSNDIERILERAEQLEWSGICLTSHFEKNFSEFSKKAEKLKAKGSIEIFTGAEINENIRKNSIEALKYSDFNFAACTGEDATRNASDCWELHVLCQENPKERDFMDQKNSGIDHIVAKLLKEKGIALELNFSDFLNSYGMARAQRIGRARQNILLARKYKILLIITSGAKDIYGMRAPRELISFGKILGMTDGEAKNALEKNPLVIIKKSADRKNPDKLLTGLEVVNWGKQKKAVKKPHGFY